MLRNLHKSIHVHDSPRKLTGKRVMGIRVWGTVDLGNPNTIGRFSEFYPESSRDDMIIAVADLLRDQAGAKINLYVRNWRVYEPVE